jgi:hypothetical protein
MSKLELVTGRHFPLFRRVHTNPLIARNYDDGSLQRHSRALRFLAMAVIAITPFAVVSCGGGSQPAPQGTPPSNLAYTQNAINATVGTAIAAETPIVTGTVSSYSCSPTLPAGLVLDSSGGTISGTPTAASATSTYKIRASNSFGSTTTSIQITVSPAPPPPSQLSYPQTSMVLEVGQPFAANIPSHSGSVESFSISPSLPAGLTLDAQTGAIHGISSASSTSNVYTVTASNQGGRTTAGLKLAVSPGVATLLDLGAVNQIVKILSSNGNVIVQDLFGHWVLIDYVSGTKIASGEQGLNATPPGQTTGPWPLEVAGSTLAVGVANGLEVRSAIDGHLLGTIASPMIDPFGLNAPASWWRLASDGSYICAGSSAGLIAWSTTGNVLLTRTGNYSNANVFAGPGRIQIALGAAGANVVETVLLSDGSSSLGPVFSGSFNTWFLDGSRFLTNLSNGVWTYDSNSAQQSFVTLATFDELGGEGNWIWTIVHSSGAVTVYPVGSSNAAGSYSAGVDGRAIASGNTIGLLPYGTPSVKVIDLSGHSPAQNTYTVPTAYNSAYAATSGSVWLVGNWHGTVVDGASVSTTPRFLTQGTALNIAGSTSEVAVAVANGTIYSFNPSITTPQQSISFSSSHVELSADATVLAAAANTTDSQYQPDRTLNVYALPAATLTHSWPYELLGQPGETDLFGFSLAAEGTKIGQVSGTWDGIAWHFLRQVTAVTGGPANWSDIPSSPTPPGFFPSPPELSPNGNLIAAASDVRTPTTATTIYNNGTPVTSVPGFAVAWIDDTELLVDSYVADVFGQIHYSGCTIYSPTGAVLSSPPLPEIQSFQSVSPGLIYTPDSNTIYSTSSGKPTWTSTYRYGGVGATASGYVVFLSGARVVAENQ